VREAPADHHGLQIDVQPCRDERLVATGHDHQFVGELVVGAPPIADLVAQRPLLRFGHRLDDQHLEIQLIGIGDRLLFELPGVGREDVLVVQTDRVDVAGAVRIRGQRPVDPRHGARELVVLPRREEALGSGELRCAGVRPIRLQRGELRQQVGDERGVLLRAVSRCGRPTQTFSRLVEPAPGVRPQLPDGVVRV
jgi:hypothetical protein